MSPLAGGRSQRALLPSHRPLTAPTDHWAGSSCFRVNEGQDQGPGAGTSYHPQGPARGPAPYCSASLKNW